MTNTKWAIAGLFGLGLVAAVCAAVLAASWQSRQNPTTTTDGHGASSAEVTVTVAKHDLAAMTVIDADAITTRNVPQTVASPETCIDPVQVVGKVLLVPVKAGQSFALSQFATEGSTTQLAAALQHGDRAVSVALTDAMALEDLLYPGSIVDVLFSRAARTEDGLTQQPLSITLLQGVRVLAVGERTIVSPKGPEGVLGSTHNGRPSVSLLVDSRQAQILKLAMQEGSVTLALRNPMDEASASVPATGIESLWPTLAVVRNKTPTEQPAVAPPQPVAPPATVWKPWETVIIKGGVSQSVTFPHDTSGRAP